MELNLLQDTAVLQLKSAEQHTLVWDIIRLKWLVITPEEMVRNLYVHYLIKDQSIPKNKISLEKSILVGLKKRRYDILIHDEDILPWMAIECKSPDIILNESVTAQIVLYNQSLDCKYLTIINGYKEIIFEKNTEKKWLPLSKWPVYKN